MSTPSRSSGIYGQDDRLRETYHAGTVGNAPDEEEEPYVSQDDLISLFREPTAASIAVLRRRAAEIRDILSTFSRNDFPSEHVKANIYDRISFLERPKALEDCIEKEDLVSTIFLLAVNNWAQYRILRHVLPKELCAQHFQQKLQRRINTQIQAFDVLDIAARSANPPDRDYVQTQVGIIAAELSHIAKIVRDDRRSRPQGEAETAGHLVYMMQAVCHRNYHPGEQHTGRQTLGFDRSSNLFYTLFSNTKSGEARFGLDAMRVFSKHAIMQHYEDLKAVRKMLVHNDIPLDYLREFDETTGVSD